MTAAEHLEVLFLGRIWMRFLCKHGFDVQVLGTFRSYQIFLAMTGPLCNEFFFLSL